MLANTELVEMATTKKPETYASLLSLDKEVQKKPKPFKKVNTTFIKAPNQNRDKRSRSRSPRSNKRKKSLNLKVPKGEEVFLNWDLPDRQYGDLYCKPCDSHMNSEQMWEAHISGKRHLKNVKKGDQGDMRYIYVDEDPIMMPELEEETRPLVGLHHLVEIQRLEQQPIYQCFLCSASLPNPKQLLEHLAGVKHRLAYLKEHDNERYELIQKSNLKKGHIEPVVAECIEKHESLHGRGKMLVKQEQFTESSPNRNNYKDDYPRPSNRDDYSRPSNKDDYSHPSNREDYSRPPNRDNYSRPPNRDNYSQPSNRDDYSPPPKTQSNKEDLDRLPKRYRTNRNEVSPDTTQKSSRNNEHDRGRSYEDRPYAGHPEDSYSSREHVRDREAAYYKRSPEREKGRLEDERYAYSKYSHPDRYNTFSSSEDAQHSKPMDEKYGDLREVLEKKKTDPYFKEADMSQALLEEYRKNEIAKAALDLYRKETMTSSLPSSYLPKGDMFGLGTSTLTSMTGNIPDAYLELVEAMSPTVFLQLALFKINRIGISTELELKLLDKLSSKCTALSMEIKASQLPTNLKDQFKETMVQSGLAFNPQFTKDFEQMMEMVGQVKASSKGGNSQQSSESQAVYSTPSYVTVDNSSANQWGSVGYQTQQPVGRSSWQHVDANTSQSMSSHSSSSYIPGLTLTDDTPTSHSSPFDLLTKQTNDILGGLRSKQASQHY